MIRTAYQVQRDRELQSSSSPSSSSTSTAAPTSAEQRAQRQGSRLLSPDTKFFKIPASGVLRPFQGYTEVYSYATVHGAKSIADGIPTANDAAVNVGRKSGFLPFVLPAGDTSIYVPLDPGPGNLGRLSDIYVSGTAGDGIVVEYGTEE